MGPRSRVILVPTVPSKWLSPNRKAGTRTAAITQSRERARLRRLAREAAAGIDVLDGTLWMSAVVSWPPGRRTWDDDNLIAALKPVRDGIADALGRDDADIRWSRVDQVRGAVGAMTITVREDRP